MGQGVETSPLGRTGSRVLLKAAEGVSERVDEESCEHSEYAI